MKSLSSVTLWVGIDRRVLVQTDRQTDLGASCLLGFLGLVKARSVLNLVKLCFLEARIIMCEYSI